MRVRARGRDWGRLQQKGAGLVGRRCWWAHGSSPGIRCSSGGSLRLADTLAPGAGVDPHADDALGRLALTDDGLRRRELLVSEDGGGLQGSALGTSLMPVTNCRYASGVSEPSTHGPEAVIPSSSTSAKVLDSCLGAGVPVAGYVGGGYHGDLAVLAARHCWLHRAAAELWADHGL